MKPTRPLTIAVLAVVGATLPAAPAAAQSMTDDEGTSGNETIMNDGSVTTTDSMSDGSMDGGSMAQNTTEQMDDSGTTSGTGPGFTVGLALVALAGIGLLAARRRA